MEILVEIVGFIVIEIILSGVGWLCLFVWYRHRKKMEIIKNEKYAGAYSSAGQIFILNLIAGVGAISMFGIVIFFMIFWVYKLITN
jgi:hypothetical protein